MLNFISLRRARRVLAALYFLLFLFVFVDFSQSFSPSFINGLLYLQFTPSVLQFFKIGGLLASGFIVVAILTLLFGRVYCSVICPLGIFQDIVARLRLKRPRYKYFRPWNLVRYISLAIVVIAALAGSLSLLYWLDPYSFAGRIFSNLVRPIYYAANNLMVDVLGMFNSYALHHVEFKAVLSCQRCGVVQSSADQGPGEHGLASSGNQDVQLTGLNARRINEVPEHRPERFRA